MTTGPAGSIRAGSKVRPIAASCLGSRSGQLSHRNVVGHGLRPAARVSGSSFGATYIVSIGFIEGAAEGMMSFARIASGLASDLLGRRKPLVMLGYGVSALNKIMFPLAGVVSVVLAALRDRSRRQGSTRRAA